MGISEKRSGSDEPDIICTEERFSAYTASIKPLIPYNSVCLFVKTVSSEKSHNSVKYDYVFCAFSLYNHKLFIA